MDNEEYRKICNQIGDASLSKLDYILNTDFSQKTEQASLVIQMLNGIKEYDQQRVFVSRLIAHYESELMKLKLRLAIGSHDD